MDNEQLTDERIEEIAARMEASDPSDSFWKIFARAIASELRTHPTAQPAQPVAWLQRYDMGFFQGSPAMFAQPEGKYVRYEDVAPNIGAMVDRFLGWRLPPTFAPDAGIRFKPYHPDQTPHSPLWPIGTNLFTADEARTMLEYVLASPKTGEGSAIEGGDSTEGGSNA